MLNEPKYFFTENHSNPRWPFLIKGQKPRIAEQCIITLFCPGPSYVKTQNFNPRPILNVKSCQLKNQYEFPFLL